MNPTPDRPDRAQAPADISLDNGALEKSSIPVHTLIERDRLTPDCLTLRALSKDELYVFTSHFHLPFDEADLSKIVEGLYGRKQLPIAELRRSPREGVALDCAFERLAQAGGGSYKERRSLTLKAGGLSDGGDGALFPFLRIRLERAESDRAGQRVDVKLSWEQSELRPIQLADFELDLSASRWQPADELASLFNGSAAPARMPGNAEGVAELDLSPRMSLRALEQRPVAESAVPIGAPEAVLQRAIAGDPSWVPVRIALEDPTPNEQLSLLSALGLDAYSQIVEGGFSEAVLAATESGEMAATDRLWELYSLPTPIEIQQKTTFVLGDEEYIPDAIDLEDDTMLEEEDYEPELGESEGDDGAEYREDEMDGDPDEDELDGDEAPDFERKLYDWPTVIETSLRGLPASIGGAELRFESVLVEEAEGEDGNFAFPDRFAPGLAVRMPHGESMSGAEIAKRWALHADVAATLRQKPMLEDIQSIGFEDSETLTLSFDFERFKLDVKATRAAKED